MAQASLPYEILKASVKALGAMAHRVSARALTQCTALPHLLTPSHTFSQVSARKIMYDPESAEGVMHVLSHPDSSQAWNPYRE